MHSAPAGLPAMSERTVFQAVMKERAHVNSAGVPLCSAQPHESASVVTDTAFGARILHCCLEASKVSVHINRGFWKYGAAAACARWWWAPRNGRNVCDHYYSRAKRFVGIGIASVYEHVDKSVKRGWV